MLKVKYHLHYIIINVKFSDTIKEKLLWNIFMGNEMQSVYSSVTESPHGSNEGLPMLALIGFCNKLVRALSLSLLRRREKEEEGVFSIIPHLGKIIIRFCARRVLRHEEQ